MEHFEVVLSAQLVHIKGRVRASILAGVCRRHGRMQFELLCRCEETGREQVWVVEPVRAGQEITISYIREEEEERDEEEVLADSTQRSHSSSFLAPCLEGFIAAPRRKSERGTEWG